MYLLQLPMFHWSAGGVCIVRPSGGEWCRCRYRGHRLQVWAHTHTSPHYLCTCRPALAAVWPHAFTLSRLQEPGSLQRISSRRRKRPRVSRQDTTESEDDGGRSHRSHRWNLRLSPDRAHSRTILEVRTKRFSSTDSSCSLFVPCWTFCYLFFASQESISQVRPLVICRPNADRHKSPVEGRQGSGFLMSLWPSSLSLPLILLLSLPLSLSLVILIVSFFLPWVRAWPTFPVWSMMKSSQQRSG